jgi:protein tyrosine phosphatase (PTP) superfamily phosphohydrolase (DUF442 family)
MSLEDMKNFLRLSDDLCTAGMPTAEQLSDAAQKGVRVVINLALHENPDALKDETKIVQSLGMKYINIPVIWNSPTRENLDQFLDTMDAHAGANVLVHCQANFRATGFVTLHRILRQGWERDRAFADLRRIWNPEDYPIWKKFIDDALATA